MVDLILINKQEPVGGIYVIKILEKKDPTVLVFIMLKYSGAQQIIGEWILKCQEERLLQPGGQKL